MQRQPSSKELRSRFLGGIKCLLWIGVADEYVVDGGAQQVLNLRILRDARTIFRTAVPSRS